VLATCAGPRTTTALLPILDDPSLSRAVYAAWVLAQSPQLEIARRALRRLALHGLFHTQTEQHGEAVDFAVAPGIAFHQSFAEVPERDAKVVLPSPLAPPGQLDGAELNFLLREYRESLTDASRGSLFASTVVYEMLAARTDGTWLPFFQIVAQADPGLTARHVDGRTVAHFPERKLAAAVLTRKTGKPATYLGLGGEAIDSADYPAGPYAGQNLLVARFLLDRMSTDGVTGTAGREWGPRRYYDGLIDGLLRERSFGAGLEHDLLEEANRRGLGGALRTARLRLWTER
jgi:hypothetical protein